MGWLDPAPCNLLGLSIAHWVDRLGSVRSLGSFKLASKEQREEGAIQRSLALLLVTLPLIIISVMSCCWDVFIDIQGEGKHLWLRAPSCSGGRRTI